MGIMAFGALGLIFIRVMYMWENKRRSAEIASWDEDRFIDEANSLERRGDQRKTFMYGY